MGRVEVEEGEVRLHNNPLPPSCPPPAAAILSSGPQEFMDRNLEYQHTRASRSLECLVERFRIWRIKARPPFIRSPAARQPGFKAGRGEGPAHVEGDTRGQTAAPPSVQTPTRTRQVPRSGFCSGANRVGRRGVLPPPPGPQPSIGSQTRRAFRFHRRPCEKAGKESENPLNESGDLSVDVLEVKLNPKPRREEGGGGCEIAESRTVFVYSEPPRPSLVGISEPDPNLFIIFEGISPIGPCE